MQKRLTYALFGGMALAPLAALAQVTNTGNAFTDFLNQTGGALNTIIVFLFLVATVMFLFGVLRYITAGGDEEKVKEGRNMILYGIIGLAVMIALWAFVNVGINFFFGDGTSIGIPGAADVPQQ